MGLKEYEVKNIYLGFHWEPSDLTLAYYPMDGDLKDYSGNGFDQTVTTGSYAPSTNYNIVSALGSKNTTATYSNSSSYTLIAWGNITNNAITNFQILGSDSASGGWGMAITNQAATCVIGSTQYTSSASDISYGDWHLYVGVFDYENHKLIYYIDGVKQSETNLPTGGLRGGNWVCFGRGGDNYTTALTGKLGEHIIEATVWSQDRILAYYNSTKDNYITHSWEPNSHTKLYVPMKTSIAEESGNATITNTGVVVSSTLGVPCGYFNGSSYIDTSVDGFANGNHTLSIWYKTIGSGSNGSIITCNPSGITKGDYLYIPTTYDYVEYGSYGGNSATGQINGALEKDRWNNIIYSGGNLYINGVKKSTYGSASYSTGTKYTIGGHAAGGSTRTLNIGYIREAIIEDVVWDDDMVAKYFEDTKDEFGWFNGEDTILYLPMSNTFTDYSTSNLSFTNQGGVTIVDNTGYFNGSSYLWNKSFSQIQSCQEAFTVSAWMKRTGSTSDGGRVVVHHMNYTGGKYRGYTIEADNNSGVAYTQNSYHGALQTAYPLDSGEWINFILVRGNPSKIYIDGVEQTVVDNNNLPELYPWIGIGGGMWYNSTMGEYKWIGNISDVIIEKKQWTANEVADYYNKTYKRYKPTVLTYDFQNDGDQGWTWSGGNAYTTTGFNSTYGAYFTNTGSAGVGAGINPPSSIYGEGTLSRVRIWGSIPRDRTWFGMYGSYSSGYRGFRYERENGYSGYIGFCDGNSEGQYVGQKTGEMLMDVYFISNKATGTLGGTAFDITSSAAQYIISGYANGGFSLTCGAWGVSGTVYIKKIELTLVK